MRQDALNILILCDFDRRNANVIRDFLYCFNAYSRHNYLYVHDCKNLSRRFDCSRYDVIVLFWDCLWFWGMPIKPGAMENIARSSALKLLFLQDEYRNVRHNNGLMARLGIQVMMTLVAPRHHELIYPRSGIPSLQAIYTVLTGYVPDYMVGLQFPPFESRPIDIGYRSRVMPFHLGDLAREKLTIAQQFEQIAAEHGFVADISVREVDRLYGEQWPRFLQSCKFALGTESGASVIDFSGMIHYDCAVYLMDNPAAPYEEVRNRFFAEVDGRPDMKVISARVFESAAYGNVLVQHEGEYAGMLRPDEHYIAVKKDYSNVAEVVERMRDTAFCKRLRDNAYRDLIASGRYSYRAFVAWFDEVLAAHAPAPTARLGRSKAFFYLTNYILRSDGLIPKGTAFVRVPRPTLVGMARTFWDLARALPSLLLVLAVLWEVPVLRRPVLREFLQPRRWRRGDAVVLWRDLVRLGLVRGTRGARLLFRKPFQIEARCGAGDGCCLLVSVPLANDQAGSCLADPPADLRHWSAHCGRLIWDHSACGTKAALILGYTSEYRVEIDASGDYWFRALGQLCAQASVSQATVVSQVLSGGPCALRSWQRLRLPLVLYGLGDDLVYAMFYCWRSPIRRFLQFLARLGTLSVWRRALRSRKGSGS